MLEIEREHDTTSPCKCCKPQTQGECDAPHLFPFVVGFAIKNMHTHTKNKNNKEIKK
jgi:hypothetical protein